MSALLSEATLRRSTLPLLRPEPEDRVLDLCCGTGPLAVRTKQELRRAEVVGCDIDPAALSLAG